MNRSANKKSKIQKNSAQPMLGHRLENLFDEPTTEFSTNVSMRKESRAWRHWSLDLVHQVAHQQA
jgi:hypothetical protein